MTNSRSNQTSLISIVRIEGGIASYRINAHTGKMVTAQLLKVSGNPHQHWPQQININLHQANPNQAQQDVLMHKLITLLSETEVMDNLIP